jgi:hypothetical protein
MNSQPVRLRLNVYTSLLGVSNSRTQGTGESPDCYLPHPWKPNRSHEGARPYSNGGSHSSPALLRYARLRQGGTDPVV